MYLGNVIQIISHGSILMFNHHNTSSLRFQFYGYLLDIQDDILLHNLALVSEIVIQKGLDSALAARS